IKEAYLKQDYLAVKVTADTTVNPDTNTVAIAINVETGPRVQIEITGLKINDKDKQKALPFYTQGGIDDVTLEEGRRSLLDYAQRHGYFFAEVTRPSAPDLSGPNVKL